MKKKHYLTILTAFLLTFSGLVSAQTDIVITELNYNAAEPGADSTEYVELYNKGTDTVDMNGYQFTSGFVYTFPSGISIAPGGYLVVAIDSVAVQNRYGITGVLQWNSGSSLSNGGEPIALKDGLGNLVDTLRYDDNLPWPDGSTGPADPDGHGPSIVLCDPNSDNADGSNWIESTTSIGITVNGDSVYSSPGASDDACVPSCINTSGTDTQTACDTYTWIDGNTYTASNSTATHTLTNAAGCDSVVTLNLTINTSTTGTDTQTACDTYTWIDGNTYTESDTTATHTLMNANGCDSIVNLALTILQIPVTNLTESACASFTFGDSTYTTSGNYTDTLTAMAANGCDSIVNLALTILQIPVTNLTESACGSFTFGDSTYTTSGNYTDTLTAMATNGCDSIVTLNLTINQSSTGTDTQVACGSYTWIDGNTYTESNTTATHTLMNANGCDSIVNLALTILENTSSNVMLYGQCVNFNGVTYMENIDTTITLVNSVGCDSIVSLSVFISQSDSFFVSTIIEICEGETVQVGDSTFSEEGTFTQAFMGVNCLDSIVIISIIITPKPIISNPQDLLLETAQDYVSYQWLKDGNEINGATSFQYNATENGNYQVEAINDSGCVVLSESYNINSIDIKESALGRFMVYPNPTKENATIQIPFGEEFNMDITNVLGEIVLSQKLVNTETVLQISEFNKGIYFINLYNEKGNQTLRFVKN